MPGVRQAWSSFSMAPRQKYGQDRGHVSVSGPMRGQHCRDLAQSQPRVTGTWVCRDKLLSDSIAVGCRAGSYPRVSESERERDRAGPGSSCLTATGLEPGLWVGPAPGTRVLWPAQLSPCSALAAVTSPELISILGHNSPQLSVQRSLPSE